MNRLLAAGIAFSLSLAGGAAFGQGSNPGISTTPGLTTPNQPGNPSNPQVNVQSIQNLPVGPQQPSTSGVGSTLQFVPITVTAPQVLPTRFGTVNVMSTVTPLPTVSQPQPTVTSTTTTTTFTPAQTTFTFTPSQTFVPITAPRPYNPPSTSGFSAR